jgi:hypothetical protein
MPEPEKIRKKRPRITEEESNQLRREFLDLYKHGMSTGKAAKQLGFTRTVIYKWAGNDPEFAEEYERIRLSKVADNDIAWNEIHGNDEENKKIFLERYADPKSSVYEILESMADKVNKHAIQYWKKTDPDFVKKLEELQRKKAPRLAKGVEKRKALWREDTVKKQNLFLEVYRNSLFNITETCKTLGIPRTTVMDWKKKDPDFKTMFDSFEEEKKDLIEYAALKKIKDGDTIMTIFAAKCHLGDRGWVEKPQDRKLTVEHKYDKATIDAVVRAAELSQGNQFSLPNIQRQISIPNEITEAEYAEVESD